MRDLQKWRGRLQRTSIRDLLLLFLAEANDSTPADPRDKVPAGGWVNGCRLSPATWTPSWTGECAPPKGKPTLRGVERPVSR